MKPFEIQYMWTVQAIAQSVIVQLSLYPNFVVVADELVLEHHEALEMFKSKNEFEAVSGIAKAAIQKLDETIDRMSGPANAELWTIVALEKSPEWVELRELAKQVLQAFGWPDNPPPVDRGAIYIGSGPDSSHDN